MESKNSFFKMVCNLAIPVTLQSMLQSSFSIVDQIMIGQLGSVSVAGVGLAGKFASIYSVVISAIGAVAGIMISQYLGQKNAHEVRRSFYTNLLISVGIAGIFTALCILFPGKIMGLYTKDLATQQAAAAYLLFIAGTFIPLAGATLFSTLLRCTDKPQLPLYASIASAVLNTGLNYILIFGKFGIAPMGAQGAAIATVISQWVNFLLMVMMMPKKDSCLAKSDGASNVRANLNWKQYLSMLLPILVCEVGWSLGENVYAAIYGHMGTDASAAMTLINPIQGLLIGALCGLSQAASVIIGKKLGNEEYEDAYVSSKKLILYGGVGAALLSMVVILTSALYVEIYRVEEIVKELTRQILVAYALVAPFKVLNMILGGGIIRSGGRTKYVMFIDLIGTWCFGVPLGLLAAFVLKLSIPYVYFILSLEECIRFGISLVVFRNKKWMNRLEAGV
ncbi:MAG: MATE family efflux transporter [Lachnospiraceae bacterium]|nr:MATE family efflux transporter [Lachnospiraceae bacterium]